ncbi:hypothetical protein L6164_023591 [Bauhinia variegata]|uniref:Uncharacterized protein n=1 Tax=Bauhinia variegata TaxID=167791 RepID=A0ACB9MJ51_BAUVA|nr:hypothetical protein L6164_023591 [Bauhinia variegata]
MAGPGTSRISKTDEQMYQDKIALIAAKDEETVDTPRGMIPEDNVDMQEHNEVIEDLGSLSSMYRLATGQCDISDVNDIKEMRTHSYNNALHIAARYGINEVVKKIAETDIDLIRATNLNGDRAAHVASRAGQICTLQTLLAVFAQHLHNNRDDERLSTMLTDKNKQGNTIFHEALIHGGHKGAAIFEALASPVTINDKEGQGVKKFSLESDVYGEDVALSVNKEGKTPLYLAIEFGYKSIVGRLMRNCKGNPKGKSPILAAIIKRHLDMLDIILSNNAKWLHIKDDQGWLPLHYAAYFGYLDGVSKLLDKCTSCTLIKTDKYGLFPIHLASYGGHLEVFKKLLSYCLDPCEMLNEKDQNVLHIAAKRGKYNVVSYILQDSKLENMINQKDEDGNTPLHLAAQFFHARVVQTLTWNKRVDLTTVNKGNKTALDVAVDATHTNPTLRERLTWSALKSAKTPQSHPQFIVNKTEDTNNGSAKWKEASLKKKSQDEGTNIEPFKDRVETLIVVSTLIVTVAFAAAIQFPGGSNDEDGQAKLLDRGMFQLYIISITTSLYGALIATIILFLARLGDITLLQLALEYAMPILGITLTTLSLAFLAAIYLVISKLTWLVTIFLLMSIIFIFMIVSVYVLLFLPSRSSMPIVRNMSYYPFLLLAWLDEKKRKRHQ